MTYTFDARDFLQALIELAKKEPSFQQYLDGLNQAAESIATIKSPSTRRAKRRRRKARY